MKLIFLFVLLSCGLTACQNDHITFAKKHTKVFSMVPHKRLAPVQANSLRYLYNVTKDLTYLQTEQGLPDNFISVIFKDKRGFLWIGTNGKGVWRYNGQVLEHFAAFDKLSNSLITSIYEDSKSRVWVGTYHNGAMCFDGKTTKAYTKKEGLPINRVNAITEDQNHNIWLATISGVSVFNGDKFKTFTKKDGLPSGNVLSVLTNKKGKIWLGTANGLSHFDGQKFKNFSKKDGLIGNLIQCLNEDSKGNLWIGTYNGLSNFDGNVFRNYTKKEGLLNDNVHSIWLDEKDKVWIGTSGGINYFDGLGFKEITTKDGLVTNHVTGIQADQEGSMWISTYGGGLCRYRVNSFQTLNIKENFRKKTDYVYAIEEHNNDGILLGTLHQGVINYQSSKAEEYRSLSSFTKNSSVYSILKDQNGSLWCGTSDGLVVEKDGKQTKFTRKEGLTHPVVLNIANDGKGGKWISTANGLSHYDGKKFKNFAKRTGLLSGFTSTVAVDHQGNSWIGTGSGLNYYDGNTLLDYSSKHPLLQKSIVSLLEDSQKWIWIGTVKGLVMYDGKTYQSLPFQDTQPIDEIWALVEDKQGNIWVGTMGGLHLLHRAKNSDAKENLIFGKYRLFSFSSLDGLRKGVSERAMKIDSKNRLWLGNSEGATYLDLNTFKIPTKAPKTPHMTHIKVQNQYIDFRQLQQDTAYQAALGFGKDLQKSYHEVAQWFNYPKHLILPHTLNHLSFHFSAIDWAAPHKLKFRYRLVGLEDEWSVASTENFADYRNIPYGKYTFEVQAIGVAQKWSKTFTYSFEIRPPWWHTWWARAVYGLLGLALIIGYVQWRLAGYKKRQKLLEQALIGPLIQGYRLIELIGEGGFGRVYKAVQLRTEQLVAIKLLKDSKHSSQHQIDRFERETQLCAQISHPNIVKLLDKGHTEDGDLFAAFEYIEGETLKNRIIRKGVLSGVETGLLMAQVLDALSCAHEQGIVHRDLKPQNLMVGETSASMHIKVLDFGVGAFTEDFRTEDYKSLTITKETLGTPTYSAPEQLWGEAPTVKSDLYAWGLIVLECLTGTPVMGGNSLAEVFEKQINAEDVVIPDNILEHPLGDLLKRVLEKKTEKRVGSATRLYQECLEIDFNTLVVQAVAPANYEAIDDTTMDNDLAVVLGKIHQQQITVFCVQLDLHIPEDSALENEKLMSIQKDQLNRCISIVQSNGGYLANSFGNKLTFYFGYPKQSDTHAQLAGQVALELLHHIQEQHKVLRKLYSFKLDTRMSIHTGEVLVKQNHEPEGLVQGVALNLLSQAKSNSILVSNASKQRIDSLANFEDSGSYTFSGIRNPIQVFSLVEGAK